MFFCRPSHPTGWRTIGNPTYYGTQHTVAGYVNDSIRVGSQLTADLGLRYDHASVPYGETLQSLNSTASVPGVYVFSAPKPQYLNFAPRLGLAWSPGTAGATVFRAGFGMTYDVLYDNIGINSQPPQFSTLVTETPTAIQGFLASGGIAPDLFAGAEPSHAQCPFADAGRAAFSMAAAATSSTGTCASR